MPDADKYLWMPGMSTLASKSNRANAVAVHLSASTLCVELTDGRTVTVPLEWYPRLLHGTVAERNNWRLIGAGEGVHWPDLDEDISIEGLLEGRRSAESSGSFRQWLVLRNASRA